MAVMVMTKDNAVLYEYYTVNTQGLHLVIQMVLKDRKYIEIYWFQWLQWSLKKVVTVLNHIHLIPEA